MSIDIPTIQDLADLTQHRDGASVTVYLGAADLGSGKVVHAAEAAPIALRSAVDAAIGELTPTGLSPVQRDRLTTQARAVEADRDVWSSGARSVAVFLSPAGARVFRLMNELPSAWSTGDRFDVGPLIRAVTFEHVGYVVALTEGEVRLLHLDSTATAHAVPLPELPADVADELVRTPPPRGQADRLRAGGTLGPKTQQERYARVVQAAVQAAITDPEAPIVLAAAPELGRAYRAVNTSTLLLERGIEANPSSLTDADLQARARVVLDDYYATRIAAWRERFGTLRAAGRAGAQISDVARSAWAGLVSDLLFDIGADQEGTIDDYGTVTFADASGPATYRLVDAVAAQVLRTGGRVRGVRAADLPDATGLAAVFRA